jgi:hypothetical protein
MWDYQLKAFRKRRSKLHEDTVRKAPYHVTRVWGELRYRPARDLDPVAHPVRFILNDLTELGVSLFSSQSFYQGQRVGLFIPEPRPFYVEAEVVQCRLFTLQQNILTNIPLPYRIAIRFLTYTKEEQDLVSDFCLESTQTFIRRAGGSGLA